MTHSITAREQREIALSALGRARAEDTVSQWGRAAAALTSASLRTRRGTPMARHLNSLKKYAEAKGHLAGGVADADTMNAARQIVDAIEGRVEA